LNKIEDNNSTQLRENNNNSNSLVKPSLISLFTIDKHHNGFTFWYNRKYKGGRYQHTKSFSFGNHYGIWKKPNEISFRNNDAEKDNPLDTCYDCTLTLGKLSFGYTNWSY